jgi:hypothetical protein
MNYLLPTDVELKDANHVEDEGLPLGRVLAKVEGAKLRLPRSRLRSYTKGKQPASVITQL